MNDFWNNEVNPGYYDLVFIKGKNIKKNPQLAWHHKTFSKISNLIEEKNILLDFACGPGTFVGQYLDQQIQPICIDISENQITYAKKHYKGKGKFLVLDEFDFEDNFERFDVITCLGLFEFISEQDGIELLNKFYKILKPNGKVYLTTPNFKISMKILEYLLNKFGSLDYSKEYQSRYTKITFDKLVKKSKFSILMYGKYMTPLIFTSIFGNTIGIQLNNFLEKITKNKYGFLMFYGLKK